MKPPKAPRHLSRLPFAVSYTTALAPEAALQAAAKTLSGRRFRVRTGPGWVAAEKGYLREAGNLLFHIALLGCLVSIGLGGLFDVAKRPPWDGGMVWSTTPGWSSISCRTRSSCLRERTSA